MQRERCGEVRAEDIRGGVDFAEGFLAQTTCTEEHSAREEGAWVQGGFNRAEAMLYHSLVGKRFEEEVVGYDTAEFVL